MKILLIGFSGTIGRAVYHELSQSADIITAGFSKGDVLVDLSSSESIKSLFETVGRIDAIINTAGAPIVFKPISEMTVDDYQASLSNKLLGQIDLVLQGQRYLNDGGSITLTTGVINRDPIVAGSAASMVNSGIEGFVYAASFELGRQLRVNVVSPNLLEESVEKYKDYFPGYASVSAEKVAKAFRKSVFGIQSGQVICVS